VDHRCRNVRRDLMTMSKARWLCLLGALVVVSSLLAACGQDEPAQTAQQAQQSQGVDLINEDRLTVGSDIPYPPFEFEKGGELTGFDVEIVQALGDELGYQNDSNDWISTDFGTIFNQLAAGTKFDIVAAAVTGYAPKDSPTEKIVADREKVVDFTVPYYPSLQSLTVDTQATPDIKSVADLPDGARVGVQRATTGAFYAEQKLKGVELVTYEKAPLMYQALQAGQLDAVFNDLPISLDAIEGSPGLEVVEQVPTGEQYAIAVAKNNPELKKQLDDALKTIFQNGTYTDIFKKYFPDQQLPKYASE
jgi:polar amino acid transport system substrate-binding protein